MEEKEKKEEFGRKKVPNETMKYSLFGYFPGRDYIKTMI